MKKSTLIILVTFLLVNKSHGQITRDNWMVGGNASFIFTNSNIGSNVSKSTNLTLAPNIGYFFIDKFAGGVRLSFNRDHIKFGPTNNSFSTFTTYAVGPFIRYYFLDVDKQYNILLEGSYQFGNEKIETTNSKNNTSTSILSFSAGPVIYFNSSVGIEFLVNYSSTGINGDFGRSNLFGAGIGFQVHLQKDKN